MKVGLTGGVLRNSDIIRDFLLGIIENENLPISAFLIRRRPIAGMFRYLTFTRLQKSRELTDRFWVDYESKYC
jgi:hypothetical protein